MLNTGYENRRMCTRNALRDSTKLLRRGTVTREKEHYRNQEQHFGQVHFSPWLFHKQLMLSYKFKDILTKRLKWSNDAKKASLQQVRNKAETVLANSPYVLRTSHSVAKSQPTHIPRGELGKLGTRPCSARARGRQKDFVKVTETLSPWEGGKCGFNKITLVHYYSNRSLQRRPSLTL